MFLDFKINIQWLAELGVKELLNATIWLCKKVCLAPRSQYRVLTQNFKWQTTNWFAFQRCEIVTTVAVCVPNYAKSILYSTSLWNKPESRSNGLLNALWPSTVKIVFLAMLTVAWNKLVFLTDLLGPVSKKFSSGYHPYTSILFPHQNKHQKHTSSCRFYFCDSFSTLQYDICCKPAKYNNFILFWNSVIQYVLKKKIYKLFKKQMQIFVSN